MSAPAIRFPEFSDSWRITTLGDEAKFSKGRGISKSDIVDGGATPCIRYGQLYTDYGTVIDNVISATNVDPAALRISVGGEVIIPASGEDAKDIATAAVVLHAGVALGGDLNIITTEHDGSFLASYLSGKKRPALAVLAQGNSVVHLYPRQLSGVELAMPSLPEQRRIADALSAVDAKIDVLGRKRDALARFKAGLMQKLFSQEVRFTRDDGSAYPDWEEKRLGEAFVERSERGYPDAMLLAVTQSTGVVKAETLERGVSDSADRSKYKRVIPGDIAYNSMRMWQGASGLSLWEGIVSPAYTVVTPNSDQDGVFWSYLFKHPPVVKDFERFSQGLTSDTWNLKFPAFSKVEVVVPIVEEQERIASALSAIDDRLNKAATQITTMQAFKKGLLQQMFV